MIGKKVSIDEDQFDEVAARELAGQEDAYQAVGINSAGRWKRQDDAPSLRPQDSVKADCQVGFQALHRRWIASAGFTLGG